MCVRTIHWMLLFVTNFCPSSVKKKQITVDSRHKAHGFKPFCEKVWIVHTLHFSFLLYSYA